jgi:hypothetical protein
MCASLTDTLRPPRLAVETASGDTVPAVGEDRPDVKTERSLGDLREPAEPVDGLPPAVVTGQLAPPGFVPEQVLSEQDIQNGEVAFGERGVAMLGDDLPLTLASGRKPTSRSEWTP